VDCFWTTAHVMGKVTERQPWGGLRTDTSAVPPEDPYLYLVCYIGTKQAVCRARLMIRGTDGNAIFWESSIL
jgi:hypothetical protein